MSDRHRPYGPPDGGGHPPGPEFPPGRGQGATDGYRQTGGYGPSGGYGSTGGYGPGGGRGAGPTPSPYGGRPPGDTVAGPLGGDGYADPFAIGTPPFGWLVAAAVFGVAGAVVAAVFGATITLAGVAWLAAGPVAIGLLAVFAHRDTGQRARPVYDGRTWTPIAYGAAAVVALVGIGISAWRIAEWAGRL